MKSENFVSSSLGKSIKDHITPDAPIVIYNFQSFLSLEGQNVFIYTHCIYSFWGTWFLWRRDPLDERKGDSISCKNHISFACCFFECVFICFDGLGRVENDFFIIVKPCSTWLTLKELKFQIKCHLLPTGPQCDSKHCSLEPMQSLGSHELF